MQKNISLKKAKGKGVDLSNFRNEWSKTKIFKKLYIGTVIWLVYLCPIRYSLPILNLLYMHTGIEQLSKCMADSWNRFFTVECQFTDK